MPAKITATEQNLVHVFGDGYFFEIPLYQRPYAWTEEHVEALLDDLQDAMRHDREEPYFLGSVVLIKNDDDPRSEVVDGQQRLTTLTMLFCVLRDLSDDDELDEFVRQAGSVVKGTQDRYRLTARRRDQSFFETHIQRKGSLNQFLDLDPIDFSDSQRHMFENTKYLRDQLVQLSSEERKGLAIYVAQRCFLAAVSASDGNSARRICSVMNDRGLDLSATDVLKAEILDAISDSDTQDEYAAKWESIEENLGRDDFRDLFAHIRTIHRKDKLRHTLEEEFRDYVLGDLTSAKATAFVDEELELYADAYEMVLRSTYESTEGADKINALLRHLNRLNNFDWIPPAMEYFRRMKGQPDKLLKFSLDLERLAYGLFIRKANVNERIDRYSKVTSAIQNGESLSDDASPLQLTADERSEILATLNGGIYDQYRVPAPLLLRLDSILAEGGVRYQHPIISIEHVLPQNPAEDSQWMKWFPNEDERKRWTHRLANLVLLSRRKNTRASNYDFERKKREYFQRQGTTTFALTTQVVDQPSWNPNVLERRQEELIATLKREWRL
ncbi:MAG: DUF262 domain-containing HNH endonuclease family protein [Chloroflexi bacterium]|nr:DUF262 domain-containing HNH endonuclease family protein [Chloroflexota bacterium]